MARIDITPKELFGGYPTLPLGAGTQGYTYTPQATPGDGYSFSNSGREVLLLRNTTAGALTVTVNGPAYLGRTGDITGYSVPANGFAVLGPFPGPGFEQPGTTRKIYFQTSAVGLEAAVLRLPHID